MGGEGEPVILKDFLDDPKFKEYVCYPNLKHGS